MTDTMPRTETAVLDHWVNGAPWAGASERTGQVFNPALGTVQKEVRFASREDVAEAVDAASAAWAQWRDASIAKRQSVLGCQKRSSKISAPIEKIDPAMSTSQGPCKLLIRNCMIPKLPPRCVEIRDHLDHLGRSVHPRRPFPPWGR